MEIEIGIRILVATFLLSIILLIIGILTDRDWLKLPFIIIAVLTVSFAIYIMFSFVING